MKKIGKQSIEFDNVYFKVQTTVVGPLEKAGPLGNYFKMSFKDLYCGEKTWEKAEIRLLDEAFKQALTKGNLLDENIDVVIGGDLNNQLAANHYTMRKFKMPFLGTFSACSTCTENLILASMMIDSKLYENVACLTSSHNATSERQYRYPTEYGGQKPISMTFTATAAGCAIISPVPNLIKITGGTLGQVIDSEQFDAQDMGCAMAKAAVETFIQHLNDFKRKIDDYDLIVTGDLSYYGSRVFDECLLKLGYNIFDKHQDAGKMLYDQEKQPVYAGGSGAGCITAVLYSYLTEKIIDNTYKRILILATGALHNPIMVAQKEAIPVISHAIVLERGI